MYYDVDAQIINIFQRYNIPYKTGVGGNSEITTLCPYCKATKGNPHRHTLYINPHKTIHNLKGWVYCHRCGYTNTITNHFETLYQEEIVIEDNLLYDLYKQDLTKEKNVFKINKVFYDLLKKLVYDKNNLLAVKEYLQSRFLSLDWFLERFKDKVVLYTRPDIVYLRNNSALHYIFNIYKNEDFYNAAIELLRNISYSIILFSANYETFTTRRYIFPSFLKSNKNFYIPFIPHSDIFLLYGKSFNAMSTELHIVEGMFDGFNLVRLLEEQNINNYLILILTGKTKLHKNLKYLLYKYSTYIYSKVLFYAEPDVLKSIKDRVKYFNILQQYFIKDNVYIRSFYDYKDVGDIPSVDIFTKALIDMPLRSFETDLLSSLVISLPKQI